VEKNVERGALRRGGGQTPKDAVGGDYFKKLMEKRSDAEMTQKKKRYPEKTESMGGV